MEGRERERRGEGRSEGRIEKVGGGEEERGAYRTRPHVQTKVTYPT